ncbi:GNAT family N-acetyltransferase [Frankia sp. Cppng1_Ct_nod]|uniref:GNAT family N-acetyltransferase n=1 Tax=Frankia sp. Cppng1_Ct_nod TaxID=2897162 RepID=UPI0015844BFB|nr:GNAT family N-acetyltransferase [Frankia sp. Cppng1_Ct_nod]
MFAMRLATNADVPAVAAIIRSRCVWLEERGLPSWRDSADDVAAQAENTDGTMWVLEEDGDRIVGCTMVQEETPPWGWTPTELAESAYYLYTSVTDPKFQEFKPETLMAWWAVDRAASTNKRWLLYSGGYDVGFRCRYRNAAAAR